ncbi:hypothetical protein HSB1_27540 [Halogranum salarium B-1]|uniref:Uncharacterized protein n=1 Tax=Halogranum salarium B-1 TaxID=1210908 RepID=J3A1X9_9EURY|nr:hypothetical protein HSB1_27540 [Halogranum salarium B-1]
MAPLSRRDDLRAKNVVHVVLLSPVMQKHIETGVRQVTYHVPPRPSLAATRPREGFKSTGTNA